MKKLTFILILLFMVMFTLSCGDNGHNTSSSALKSMLSDIPSELATDNVLWFSNMERIKDLAGVEPDIEMNEYVNKTTEREIYLRRMDLFAGHTLSDFSGGVHLERWQDIFGFDAFDTSQEIWVESLLQPNVSRALFSVMNGNFDENRIIEKLTSFGYQLKDYTSIDFYSINEDYQVGDIKSSDALLAMGLLNRIMVQQREIIASPANDIFFLVLNTRSDKSNSLENSLSYTRVAEALGDVLGAAFIPQSIVQNSENVDKDWETLHTYDLAGIGYLVEGQDRKVVIALHYPDSSAADDIDELSGRMAEYMVTVGGLETSLLSDLFEIGKPKATTYNQDSILKVELVYMLETSSTLWSDLVESHNFGFLVTNP